MTDSNGGSNGANNIMLSQEQIDAFEATFNAVLGQGTAMYDGTTADDISVTFTRLSDAKITAIVNQSNIARAIVESFPSDATFGYPVIPKVYRSYTATPDKIVGYLRDRLTSGQMATGQDLEAMFREVSIKARKWGVHYLVINVQDGRLPSQPIDWDNINTFVGLKSLNKYQLRPDSFLNPSFFEFYYDINSYPYITTPVNVRIHPERVLTFYATDLSEEFEGIFEPVSALQGVIDTLTARSRSRQFANHMIVKKAIIFAKMMLPATATREAKESAARERLTLINRVASIYRMVGMNPDEELGAVQIDLNGVDKLLELNDSELIAESGLPRYKLFGESAKAGLSQSDSGLQQKLDYAQRCTAWSNKHWREHLRRLYNLACRCKDSPTSGREIRGLDVILKTNPTLSPLDWATLRKQNTEWALPTIAAGVLEKTEIREALFAPIDVDQQLIPNITLNEKVTEKMVGDLQRRLDIRDLRRKSVDEDLRRKLENSDPVLEQIDDSTKPILKVKWQGYTLALQYLPFHMRHGKRLPCAYGYVEGLKGSDDMALDCYVLPYANLDDRPVAYVIEQHIDGVFDEEKVIIGVSSSEEAVALYSSIMPSEFCQGVTALSAEELNMVYGIDPDWDEFDTSDWNGLDDENWQTDATPSKPYLVWFCDSNGSNKHRTPVAVRAADRSSAITAAKRKCSKYCDRAYSVRLATPAEIKTARAGYWIRTGAKGEKPGYKGLAGVGKKLQSDELEHIIQLDAGEIFADKDLYRACLAETKAKYDTFPSAYANGYLTKIYKERYQKKHGDMNGAFTEQTDNLEQWFKEKWVAINSSGNIVGECGSDRTTGKMKCLPKAKAESMTKSERAKLARRKQAEDPDKDRKGSPINVSSQLDELNEDGKIKIDTLDVTVLSSFLNRISETDLDDVDKTLGDL
jgi:hypothetical protein